MNGTIAMESPYALKSLIITRIENKITITENNIAYNILIILSLYSMVFLILFFINSPIS